MKLVKLADVPFGKNFEVWGHTYTALDYNEDGILALEADAVCEMQFREDEVEYKVAPNDFRDSSVRAYLEGTYTENLVRVGAKLDEDILPMELDLKCTLGQHEYGVARVHAGLLTLEQYGKYYDIIPRIDTPYWLATPWKTPSRSPDIDYTGYVWYVYSDGYYSRWYCNGAYGVRPALTLSPSLLVSVECDEEEEVEIKWHDYLEYLIHWAISHTSKSFAGCMPACYNEWLDSEERQSNGENKGWMAHNLGKQSIRRTRQSDSCRGPGF